MKRLLFIMSVVILTLSILSGCGAPAAISVKPMLNFTNENGIYLDSSGTVWTWGLNEYGGLGVGKDISKSKNAVEVMKNVVKIDTGSLHNVALDCNGTVWQWGSNAGGAFGNTNRLAFFKPTVMMKNVKDICATLNCTFAIKNDGSLWAWGKKAYGIASEKTSSDFYSSDPYKITDNVVCVKAAKYRELFGALKEDGSLWLWGNYEYGQLGNGQVGDGIRETRDDPDIQPIPQKVPLVNVKNFSLGMYSSAALLEDNSLWIWGNNEYGQVGNGSFGDGDTNTLEMVTEPYKVIDHIKYFTIDGYNSAAIDMNNNLYLWGHNDYGTCATGTSGNKNYQAIPYHAAENVQMVIQGAVNTFVIKDDNSLWAWGCNTFSRLGIGIATGGNPDPLNPHFAVKSPIKMTDDVMAITSVNNRGAYVKSDGSVYVWGQDPFYEIINGFDATGMSKEEIQAKRDKMFEENTYASPVKLEFNNKGK